MEFDILLSWRFSWSPGLILPAFVLDLAFGDPV